jgi:hypothetical protein
VRGIIVLAFFVGVAATARAEVTRYALVVGNDVGAADEDRLRYAETDARKVLDVLHTLGDFQPENTVLLLGRGAREVERVLISLNARIRAESHGPRDAMLVVYYSGHADARALHLGTEELELPTLKRLVQGSAAAFRVLLLDACRSGALTRVKGARLSQPFDIRTDEQLSGEGVAFLTSSSADEDAQESDALRGSFFTHYFVSGLRGAADRNESGTVSVEEAYDYAYQHTLRASSRTWAGLQHPTFQFDLKGRGGVPLTWVQRLDRQRTLLSVPHGRTYVLFARDAQGPVVAEVDVSDARRRLALEPGVYFVRGRAHDHLLEGVVELAPGRQVELPEADLERVEYARLARKGGGELASAHAVWLGYQARSPLWSQAGFCHGARAGYALDLPEVTLGVGLGACRSAFSNAALGARADELGLELSGMRVIDVPGVSLGAGIAAGLSWLHQSFETEGLAPARNSIAAHVDLVGSVSSDLAQGFYVLGELAGQLHVFKQRQARGAESTTAVVTVRPMLAAGKRF